jgi:hypothetical protein
MFESTFEIAKQFVGVVRILLKAALTILIDQYAGKLMDNVVPAGNNLVGVILNIMIESTLIYVGLELREQAIVPILIATPLPKSETKLNNTVELLRINLPENGEVVKE